MIEINTAKPDTSRDSDWVPRKTYDMVMEKLNAATLENQRLTAKLRRFMPEAAGKVTGAHRLG